MTAGNASAATRRVLGIHPTTATVTAANSVTPVLSAKRLCVSFPSDDGLTQAVRDVSFDLMAGEVLGVVGESGSGKSVTSMAVMGLLPRAARLQGSIHVGDTEVVGASETSMRALRGNRVAMVFQDPMTSLNPVQRVGSQLAEAYRAHHDVTRAVADRRAVDVLGQVGIPQPARRADQYPHEFSGGMRQRVMIGMAVINEPEVLIADEPTTALDVTVQAQILQMLRDLQEQRGMAIVFVSHNVAVVANVADRVQVMYAGTVVESGPSSTVLSTPRMPYTVGLLDAIPRLHRAGQRLRAIPGAPPTTSNAGPGCPFAPRCPVVQEDCRGTEPGLEPLEQPDHLARCHHPVWGRGQQNDGATR